MISYPVLSRELGIQARSRMTYMARAYWAGLTLLVAFVFGLGFNNAPNVGAAMFSMLGMMMGVVCAFDGLRRTSDCIGEESREGTLGLLWLTPVSPMQLLLGKFFRHVLVLFYGLLACLPVFGLSLLMGGVTWVDFWRLSIALITVVLVSAAAGLAFSSWFREEQLALRLGIVVLAVFALGPIVMDMGSLRGATGWSAFMISPISGLALALGGVGGVKASAAVFWSAISFGGLGSAVAFLGAARLGLRTGDRDAGVERTKKSQNANGAWRQYQEMAPPERLLARDGFDRSFKKMRDAFRALMIVCLAGAVIARSQAHIGTIMIVVQLIVFVLMVTFVSYVARSAAAFRGLGAAEALFVTPVGYGLRWMEPMIRAGRRISWMVWLEVVLIRCCLIGVAMWVSYMSDAVGGPSPAWSHPLRTLVSAGVTFAVLWMDLRAMNWLAVFLSLKGERVTSVVFWCVGVVLLAPYLPYLLTMFFGASLGIGLVMHQLLSVVVFGLFDIGVVGYSKNRIAQLCEGMRNGSV